MAKIKFKYSDHGNRLDRFYFNIEWYIFIEKVLWSIRGSYKTIWSSPLTNSKWHCVSCPNTMKLSTDQTLYMYQSVTFSPNSTFYRIMRGFHRIFAMGVACQHGTLTPSETWSHPIWDLHMFNLLRKRRKYDSVLWQNPLYQQKIQKPKDNTQTPPKITITQRLRTDLGRSVWVTSHPTGVVKPVYGYQTFPLTTKAM